MGYQFLSIGADVCMLHEGFTRVAAAFGRKPVAPAQRRDLDAEPSHPRPQALAKPVAPEILVETKH